MRHQRVLLTLAVICSLLSWGLPVAPAAAAPAVAAKAAAPASACPALGEPAPADPAPAGAAVNEPATTIQVTTETDQWDDPTKPASATSGCALREALQLLYSGGNRGCGAS